MSDRCIDSAPIAWSISIVAIMVGIVLIVSMCCHNGIEKVKLYTEHGYEQTTLPGSEYSSWVKAKGDSLR